MQYLFEGLQYFFILGDPDYCVATEGQAINYGGNFMSHDQWLRWDLSYWDVLWQDNAGGKGRDPEKVEDTNHCE